MRSTVIRGLILSTIMLLFTRYWLGHDLPGTWWLLIVLISIGVQLCVDRSIIWVRASYKEWREWHDDYEPDSEPESESESEWP